MMRHSDALAAGVLCAGFRTPGMMRHSDRDSIYYLWWEFLRRHDGYKRTCENGGKGEYEKLYANFGNVHGGAFKDWWTKDDRGAHLFAEPPVPNAVVALTQEEIEALPEGWGSGALLIVARSPALTAGAAVDIALGDLRSGPTSPLGSTRPFGDVGVTSANTLGAVKVRHSGTSHLCQWTKPVAR